MHGYKQMSSTKKNIKQNNKKTQKRNNPKETKVLAKNMWKMIYTFTADAYSEVLVYHSFAVKILKTL